jgi:hypothetical protein
LPSKIYADALAEVALVSTSCTIAKAATRKTYTFTITIITIHELVAVVARLIDTRTAISVVDSIAILVIALTQIVGACFGAVTSI